MCPLLDPGSRSEPHMHMHQGMHALVHHPCMTKNSDIIICEINNEVKSRFLCELPRDLERRARTGRSGPAGPGEVSRRSLALPLCHHVELAACVCVSRVCAIQCWHQWVARYPWDSWRFTHVSMFM